MPRVNLNHEIRCAVDRLTDSAKLWPFSHIADDSVAFLRAVLPLDHPARHPVDRAAAALMDLRRRLAPQDGADRAPEDHAEIATACASAKHALAIRPVELLVIGTATELTKLHRRLGLRSNWHEPDEQEVSVAVTGGSFDNAMDVSDLEKCAVINHNGQPVAVVNLATLFSIATGRP